jgi:LytS/YehU family sensor histidine kinase
MKLNKLDRNTLYWICQIGGWGVYVLLNSIFVSGQKDFKPVYILSLILTGLLGLFLSHLFRIVIHKKKWNKLPIQKLIHRVVIANLVKGIILVIIVVSFNLTFGVGNKEEYNFFNFIFFALNATILFFMWSVVYFSIHFFENYKRAEIESLIFESAVKDFELKSLKSQLNPHFIFNAMNSIRALIEENPEKAKEAITKLSNLMRYTLKIERTETVPLSEEIDTIKDYLDLEKIRFEERLDYEIILDKKTERIEIPPMMIQTLVENGIKHGISKITTGGKIKIQTNLNGHFMIIDITNPGKIDDEMIKNSKGFGVSNTKQRLNLIYGEEAYFKIVNSEENLVHTQLKIPIGEWKHENHNY